MTSEGDRIELVSTTDEYTKLEPGDRGTVQAVHPSTLPIRATKIDVRWDSGSTLSLIADEDEWRAVDERGDE